MKRFWVFLLLIVLVSFGCKQRVITQPESQQQSQQQKEQQLKEQRAAEEAAKAKAAPEKITEQKAAPVESVESREKAMAEKEGLFKDILFDYDKYAVQDEYKSALKSIASWMSKNNDAKLSIEGHCDDRGTNEYNLALGDRRAKAVKDYLVSLGVSSSRIETLSYGEEKPVCAELTEDCWTKNRRAHFVVLSKGK